MPSEQYFRSIHDKSKVTNQINHVS